MKKQKIISRKVLALFLILLIFNLPLISALEISQVQVQQVTDNSALIAWQTDEPANSFVNYNFAETEMRIAGEANAVTSHQVLLRNLRPQTFYQYSVRSANLVDDNRGEMYSFTTLAPDTNAPSLRVEELPEKIAGSSTSIKGQTETGVTVKLFVNQVLKGSQVATEGNFEFTTVVLNANQLNFILIEAVDSSGNKASYTATVFADTSKPQLTLSELPSVVSEKKITLQGQISEESDYEIFVNEHSRKKGSGTQLSETVSLDEGKNKIKIVLTDRAGLETVKELKITADTEPPQIRAEIEKGREYYEGRAESSISGTTKPGAKVYLYVFKQVGYKQEPDFGRAREVVTADEKGKFKFVDVNFAASLADISWQDLVPRQVPSSLADYSIPALDVERQKANFYVVLIAEDAQGRSVAWRETVTVNTCYSANLDFSVESMPEFQAPFRLVPQLLDEGKQDIQAVFDLKYQGQGLTTEDEAGYRITSLNLQKACSQSLLNDDRFNLGCKILPNTPTGKFANNAGDKQYVTWKLGAAGETSKRDENFWDDFQNRQIVFPLKMTITYEEKEGNTWGPRKVQTSCLELGYFIDIPLDSQEMLPDFLANEGVDFLNATITNLHEVKPYLETAYLVSAIGCVGSFAGRLLARGYRIITSKFEAYFSVIKTGVFSLSGGWANNADKDNSEYCPVDQTNLYLEETLDSWAKLAAARTDVSFSAEVQAAFTPGSARDALSLDKRCPKTAAAWKLEEALDLAYKVSCDRAFCRSVPASWTETKEEREIESAILSQQQCAVTGRGIPLQKVENCGELIKTNIINEPQPKEEVKGVCWRNAEGELFIVKSVLTTEEKKDARKNIYHLQRVGSILADLGPLKPDYVVYKPENSDTFIVGQDETCAEVCTNPRKPGYRAAQPSDNIGANAFGCVKEENGQLKTLPLGKYPAGYTQDCFINNDKTIIQCVCAAAEPSSPSTPGAREAVKTVDGVAEEWFYQQERVNLESGGMAGTQYSKIRYYKGRDVSGAFGANHVLDYLYGTNDIHEINPHSQYLGAFQSVCLSGILKHVTMLESILTGMRNCLLEARVSGITDAGMCKTLFTQAVCGLVYKGIAYLTSSCSPLNFDDIGKEGVFGDIPQLISMGTKGFAEGVQSSVQDIKNDYGNAQLNNFFKEGAQGLAQSMCLAAFGYEFPLFTEDFLLDAAYSFPAKTSAIIAPAERELSTYNPAKQTAVFNYNVAGVILPGCRVRNWRASLVCIGPEDVGHPGIDQTCGGQNCDCLNTQGSSPYEGEKTQLIGSGFDLTSGQMFSLPLETPIRIDSHFRYDHVKLELTLDQSEAGNAEKCFDQGYFAGNKGIFYAPLVDISPPAALTCQASLVSGQYSCPALATLFGMDDAYFEEPYVKCKHEETDTWVDCDSPNLFLQDQEIVSRAYLNVGSKGACLKRTVLGDLPGVNLLKTWPLPENNAGQLRVQDQIGFVSEEMFGGRSASIVSGIDSNSECGGLTQLNVPTEAEIKPGIYGFEILPTSTGKYVVSVSSEVKVISASYQITGNRLADNAGQVVEFDQSSLVSTVNNLEFDLGGFKVKTVLGNMNPGDKSNKCTWRVSAAQESSRANSRDINVRYELLELDESGGCLLAKERMKGGKGKPVYTQVIKIQKEKEETIASKALLETIHEKFMAGKYDQVLSQAQTVIILNQNDVHQALAFYYSISAYLLKNQPQQYSANIQSQLNAFFQMQNKNLNLPEYHKIKAYLCVVDQNFGAANRGSCL